VKECEYYIRIFSPVFCRAAREDPYFSGIVEKIMAICQTYVRHRMPGTCDPSREKPGSCTTVSPTVISLTNPGGGRLLPPCPITPCQKRPIFPPIAKIPFILPIYSGPHNLREFQSHHGTARFESDPALYAICGAPVKCGV
jgi:hypothetical protein